jgi:hypothetical protein
MTEVSQSVLIKVDLPSPEPPTIMTEKERPFEAFLRRDLGMLDTLDIELNLRISLEYATFWRSHPGLRITIWY